MTLLLSLLTALLFVSPAAAQPEPIDCPLPPYQLPLQAPERSFVDDAGDLYVSGVDAPVALPDDLVVREHIWSDDGAVMLVTAAAPDYSDSRVFAYRDGALAELLSHDDLLALRDDDFRDAVTLMNPEFVPGTHTVLFNTEVLALDPGGIHVELPLDLWSLDLDTGELAEIYAYGEGGKFHIAPDGSTLVLMNVDRIWQAGLDGSGERTLYEGAVGIGFGHGYGHPALVWDYEAEIPTFRVLLFPSYDPNTGGLDAPFEVREFTLGDEIAGRTVSSGPSAFLPAAYLSPGGYRVAQWQWQDNTTAETFDVIVYSPDGAPVTLASVDVPRGGISPFVRWDDAAHLTYGYTDGNADNLVTAWRADLCGEIIELEPYTAGAPGMP